VPRTDNADDPIEIIESFLAAAAAMPMKCRREGLEGGIALMRSLSVHGTVTNR
jgi:hypothetical protein